MGKEIDLNVNKKKDAEERQLFQWLSQRTVTVTGDNAIVNNGDGSFTVMQNNVTNGLNDSQLNNVIVAIMKENRETFEKFMNVLQQQRDAQSMKLFTRVTEVDSIINKKLKYLTEELDLLEKKKSFFVNKKISNSDTAIAFSISEELENIQSEIDKVENAINQLKTKI